jgi:hypothetical protein
MDSNISEMSPVAYCCKYKKHSCSLNDGQIVDHSCFKMNNVACCQGQSSNH